MLYPVILTKKTLYFIEKIEQIKLEELNDDTARFIEKIKLAVLQGTDSDNTTYIERETLLSILMQLKTKDNPQLFLLESLRASMLHDLRCSMFSIPDSPRITFFSKFKFWMLVMSGTIVAICDGFDDVSSFLPFSWLPFWASPVIVGLFILFSVASFYAFDLSQISDNLGVKLPETRRLLDVLLDQAKDINLMRKYVKSQLHDASPQALQDFSALIQMLQTQQTGLNEKQKIYQTQLESGHLNVIKKITTVATGVVFFSSGFFVSQAPVTAFFTLLHFSTATMVLPVYLICGVIGLAAFSLYWYVQRPGLDSFIAQWFGLNKDKIAGLNQEKTHSLTGVTRSVTDKLALLKNDLIKKQKAIESRAPSMMDQSDLKEPIIVPFLSKVMQEKMTQTDERVINSVLVLQTGL